LPGTKKLQITSTGPEKDLQNLMYNYNKMYEIHFLIAKIPLNLNKIEEQFEGFCSIIKRCHSKTSLSSLRIFMGNKIMIYKEEIYGTILKILEDKIIVFFKIVCVSF